MLLDEFSRLLAIQAIAAFRKEDARESVVSGAIAVIAGPNRWELSEIAKKRELGRIVLAFGFSKEFDSSEGWQHHPSSASLDGIFGAEWRNCCQKFCYPQRIDRKMTGQIEERMHQLVLRIYEAVVA